ncbi:MAG: glycoside hydrolase family 99-like domain-containing protein [Formivibrio sp.]|nr:glycoside hydrolase family 99-like domain-containing protein [Formivibrio sp.]
MKLRSRLVLSGLAAGTLVSCTAPAMSAPPAPQSSVQIGVYYFPGWAPNLTGAQFADPWAPISKYLDRIPLIGEYNDGDPAVMRKQLDEMNEGKISFVAFDSYSTNDGTDRTPQATLAYMKVAKANDPKFTLLWANHDRQPHAMQDWDATVTTWVSDYMTDPRFLRVNNLPVLFVYSPDNLEKQAETFGATAPQLLARAQNIAHHYGLPGIAFVGGHGPQPGFIAGKAAAQGYVALSDYNMGTVGYPMAGMGFKRRDAVYRQYWYRYKRDATLPAILPISAGWDRTPWGGSQEDGAMPTPDEFRVHVTAAITNLKGGTDPFSRMGVICCWNEFGEGSILEPTAKYGDAYLKVLGDLLSKTP